MKRIHTAVGLFVLFFCWPVLAISVNTHSSWAATPGGITFTLHGLSGATTSSRKQVSITEYHIPTRESDPSHITAGPDGNVWFTEEHANQVGRITPSGTITEFPVPTASSQPLGITSGPDHLHNLWFVEHNTNIIGRINTK